MLKKKLFNNSDFVKLSTKRIRLFYGAGSDSDSKVFNRNIQIVNLTDSEIKLSLLFRKVETSIIRSYKLDGNLKINLLVNGCLLAKQVKIVSGLKRNRVLNYDGKSNTKLSLILVGISIFLLHLVRLMVPYSSRRFHCCLKYVGICFTTAHTKQQNTPVKKKIESQKNFT